MTPEEKALELFNKMYNVDCNDDADSMQYSHAKKCALIAVDEIINELIELSNGEFTFIHKVEYWNQVKHEIEKL